MDNLEEKKNNPLHKIGLIICAAIAFNVLWRIFENGFSISPRYAPTLATFTTLLAVYPFLIRLKGIRKWTFLSWFLVCVATSVFIFLLGYFFFVRATHY